MGYKNKNVNMTTRHLSCIFSIHSIHIHFIPEYLWQKQGIVIWTDYDYSVTYGYG